MSGLNLDAILPVGECTLGNDVEEVSPADEDSLLLVVVAVVAVVLLLGGNGGGAGTTWL